MIQRCLTFAIGSALLLSWLNQPSVASELRETPARRAVQRMLPSVVNIHTEKTAEGGQTMFSSSRGRKISGMGTGIILDERGYMVTNYHVIGDVEVIRCRMADGADFEGQVVSFDRQHDLAILKVNAPRPLAIAPIGTSADLQLAESVIAIGNAFGYHDTVTIGIVSAIGRDVEVTETQSYRNLIQTDAAINPGNSGGPLINLDGEVIGINVAIRAGSQKIGFAIPIDDARQVIARLMSAEQLDQTYHGLVSKDHKTATHRHLIVDNVQLESPAARSGLQTGDIIEKVGSVPVTDAVDFERALLGRKAGDAVDLVIRRSEKNEKLSLTLAPLTSGRTALTTEVAARKVSAPKTDHDRIWRGLGVRLAPLPEYETALVRPKFEGGLRVLEVRDDSPAYFNGIRKGDILVGLGKWQTKSLDNLPWIMNQPESNEQQGLMFYIIRDKATLYGYVQVAER